jgi:hypothetical protein
VRRARGLSLLVAVAILLPTTVAAGSAREVVADYSKDGRIDNGYSIDDLRGALVFARRHTATAPLYSAFADAVNEAITNKLVGSGEAAQRALTSTRSRTEVTPAPIPPAPPSNLPSPPEGAPSQSAPVAMLVIAILAGMLLLAGLGASIWRRMRH